MTHGIRIAPIAAFVLNAVLMACVAKPDPAQLTAVDQLITATDAALLTLNELDRGRYHRSDSLLAQQRAAFSKRFTDTLERDAARALGDQFIALRAAVQMGADHERVLTDASEASERLRNLRNDLANGATASERVAAIIAAEQQQHTTLIEAVHQVIDNYKVLQQAWDRRDTVSTLLADTNNPIAP